MTVILMLVALRDLRAQGAGAYKRARKDNTFIFNRKTVL